MNIPDDALREKNLGDRVKDREDRLPPSYLNLMQGTALSSARDRILGIEKNAYNSLLIEPCCLSHWYQHLERSLSEPQLGFAKTILATIAWSESGLTHAELSTRLQFLEKNENKRLEQIFEALAILERKGYIINEEPTPFSPYP